MKAARLLTTRRMGLAAALGGENTAQPLTLCVPKFSKGFNFQVCIHSLCWNLIRVQAFAAPERRSAL